MSKSTGPNSCLDIASAVDDSRSEAIADSAASRPAPDAPAARAKESSIPQAPSQGDGERPQADVETGGEDQTKADSAAVDWVVGIGASAGGLEALEEFFGHMPSDTGLAFVVVQHLSPDFKSLMGELLARRTRMRVHRVEHNMPLERNAIYVIPPKKELRLSRGRLMLADKQSTGSLSLPIDVFFESLGNELGEHAIAVVLSGTGSDGSRGIQVVHERGGTVLSQSPESAKFNGMPRSAMDTGVVDVTGSPAELPQLLLRLSRREHYDPPARPEEPVHGIGAVLALLRREHGLDFADYKPNTIRRRIERRLVLRRADGLDDYIARLETDPEELHSLYRDLLIGVTKFFRDAEAFAFLEKEIVPKLVAATDPGDDLRVWVAGCATGEEAYSLAILFRERLEAEGRPLRIKIFATDAHRASLERAAAGIYTPDRLAELDEVRVQRHFRHLGSDYQVTAELRHMVVFAPHDVVRDAPFTKLDLVTCRNLLIYLQPATQNKVLTLMHFGLKPDGVLFLGPSETPGDLSGAFEPIHRHWKIYRRRRDVPINPNLKLSAPELQPTRVQPAKAPPQETRLLRAQQSLITRHAPPTILVGPTFSVLHTFNGGGEYLVHRDGKSSLNVLEMVESELKLTLNAALQRAKKARAAVSYGSIRAGHDPQAPKAHLYVEPVQDVDGMCFLISIEPLRDEKRRAPAPEANLPEISRARIADLEEELRYTKENLQATLEEMETANEELQATNEELVASNEELQSTNEELHSVNEELYTVNAEHQHKIEQLTELTEDMENLFSATDVGTVFLDRALKIRRFTPRLGELFHLLPQDVGREISGFAHTLNSPELMDDLRTVLETETSFERQAPDRQGNWYLVRVVPYRVGKSVDGVVLSLVDITTLKETEARLRLMSKVFKDVGDPVVIEDVAGDIIDLNPEAERLYGWKRDELLGKPGLLLVPEDHQDAERLLRQQCQENEYVRSAETVRRDRQGETHPALVTLSLVSSHEDEDPVIAIISKDITLRKQAEQAAQEAVRKRDEFLAMLSHELRNPLAVIQNAAQILTSVPSRMDPAVGRTSDVILRQVKHMASLLGDLLDVSRVTQGKVELVKTCLDIKNTVDEAVEVVASAIQTRYQQLDVSIVNEPLCINGDAARLRQIQENLLTNASKYTPDRGRISLELSREGDEAVIRVRDTGRGIPANRLESIFDLFTQGDLTLDRSDGGMGVGLTLVRSLVELHDGSIRAYSNGLNRGSLFEVRLPLVAAQEPADEAALDGEGTTEMVNMNDGTVVARDILLIEDNSDARETLQILLELDGHKVRVAADGLSGLEAIARHQPDVALVDIGLPILDGYELARRARAMPSAAEVYLIALTGYGRPEDRTAITAAGFDMHLVKPVSHERLREALASSVKPSRAVTRPDR